MKVLVLGGTGFVGLAIVNKLINTGINVARIVRSRKISDSKFKDYVGDITDVKSLESAIKDFKPEVIINSVGILKESKNVTFDNLIVKANEDLVKLARANEVKRIIYISAIGANEKGLTKYFVTKALAENIIIDSGLEYTIFRPSLIFGKDAGFTNQFVGLLKLLPFSPIIGNGKYTFAPVAIETLSECVAQSILKTKSSKRIYDVVGPETLSLFEIIIRLKQSLGVKRPNVFIPMFFMRLIARFGDLKLPIPINSDQLKMLEIGSIGDSTKLKDDFNFKEIVFDPKGKYPLY